MKHFKGLLLACFLGGVSANAQWKQTEKIEQLLAENAFEEDDVMVLDSANIFWETQHLHRFRDDAEKITWRILDPQLQIRFQGTFAVKSKDKIEQTHFNENELLYLSRRIDKNNFSILKINPKNGETEQTEGGLLTKMPVSILRAVGNKFLFGGIYNNRPVIELFNPIDRTAKVLPDLHANHLQLEGIESNPHNQQIWVVLKDLKTCSGLIKVYDYDGKLLNTIQFPESTSPMSIQFRHFDTHESLAVGSYVERCFDQSQGIFALKIEGNQLKISTFRGLETLQHFLNYLPARQRERQKAQIEKKQKQGKETHFRYHLLPRLLRHDKEETLFSAEAFYPEFQPNKLNSGNESSRFLDRYYNNFRYTHHLICAFDRNAQLLWDNAQVFDKLNVPMLLPQTAIVPHKQGFWATYTKEGLLKTNFIQRNSPIADQCELTPLDFVGFTFWEFQTPKLLSLSENALLAWGKYPKEQGSTQSLFYLWKMERSPQKP